MLTIGIIGPTGAGKTTALQELRKFGGTVIDCDRVYHELLEHSKPLQEELRNAFGHLVTANGQIDRKQLGNLVFHNPERLLRLNEITHRYVAIEVDDLLEQARRERRPAAAIDAIALVESGISDRCDCIVAVTAPREERIARIMAREGISREYAAARADAQQPEKFYLQHSDYLLYNDTDTAEQFAQQARALFESILTGEAH